MAGIDGPNLNLTSEEKRAYSALFKQADTDGLGVVTGDVAVKFFERTRLDSNVLGEIWQIADTENRGLLTPGGFNQVLRLIGHCQAGRQPSESLAKQPGPLPRFDGITLQGQNPQPSSPQTLPQQSTGPIRVPPLAPDKVNEYSALFEKAGARNGLLGGDAAKQVFEKARLPNEVLGQIWNLTDREQRGALNNTEFVVAMHLLASMRGGAMRAIPQTLPQGLYDAAGRRGSQAGVASSVPRQLTGQGTGRPQSPLARQPFGSPPVSAQPTGMDWLITPQDKARFDQSFNQLDRAGRGYITGDQAVGFFSNSGLSEDALAQIWDLADIDSAGQLSRDEFAVAMYLIRQQRSKIGDRDNLPEKLPAALIPPSMRKQAVPPSHPTAPAFDNDAFATPQTKGAAEDLFGLDALSEETPPQQPPQPPSSAKAVNFASPGVGTPTSPQAPQQRSTATGSSFKPFVPSSAFGQGIAVQSTGGSVQSDSSQPRAVPQNQVQGGDDLLAGNDADASNKVTAETMELANMSNQIGNLRNQMTEVQNKKGVTERDLATSSNQKKELEARLAQFRSQYEQEIREVKQLEEKLSTSRTDTKNIQQSLAMVEGSHQDLSNQHKQLREAFEADQRENTSLKERVQALNAEITQLKPQLEKLRSDARQHKGMVAINKKQVATSEAELENVKGEMADHQKSLESRPASSVQTVREASGSSVASPAPSVTSPSTNPFFRMNSGQQSFTQSPPARGPPASFDDVFGAAMPFGNTVTAPSTTFKDSAQHQDSTDGMRSSNVQTPTASPPRDTPASPPPQGTPNASEPPAPPASRQITSSSLPLRTNALRSESIDSSVRAIPPASRGAPSDRGTPAHSDTTESEDGDALYTDSQSAQNNDEGLAGGRSTNDAAALSPPPSSAKGDVMQGPYQGSGRKVTPDPKSSVPGAFPGEVESPMPTPSVGSSVAENHATPEVARSTLAPAANADFDSVFGTSSQSPPTLQEKPVGEGSSKKPRPQSEFPSIQNIENDDDDSDSESESEDGFGDSFTTANAPQTVAHSTTQPASDELPKADSSASPPTYEQSQPDRNGSSRTGSNQFPQKYGGLLPPRDGISSPPSVQPPTQGMSSPGGDVQHLASVADNHARASPSPARHQPAGAQATPLAAAPSTASPADDFDSAFNDLTDAQEQDEGYDAFGSSHRDDHDFNPVFDSPSHSKSNTLDTQPSPSTSTSNHRTFDNFSQFEPNFSMTSQSGVISTSKEPQQPTTGFGGGAHDWDAIFSGLDSAPSTSQANGGKSPFDLDPPGASTRAGGASLAPGPSSSGPRPSEKLARAISAGTEHDDPILKSLTSMGYPRDDALKALEKYDYNLDKAADYLTSH